MTNYCQNICQIIFFSSSYIFLIFFFTICRLRRRNSRPPIRHDKGPSSNPKHPQPTIQRSLPMLQTPPSKERRQRSVPRYLQPPIGSRRDQRRRLRRLRQHETSPKRSGHPHLMHDSGSGFRFVPKLLKLPDGAGQDSDASFRR